MTRTTTSGLWGLQVRRELRHVRRDDADMTGHIEHEFIWLAPECEDGYAGEAENDLGQEGPLRYGGFAASSSVVDGAQ